MNLREKIINQIGALALANIELADQLEIERAKNEKPATEDARRELDVADDGRVTAIR